MKDPRFSKAIRLLAGIVFLAGLMSSARAADPVGTVVTVSGGALLRSGTGDPSRGIRPVRVNDRIFTGDVINTSSNGRVKILLNDKTILDIASSSLFNVRSFEGAGKDRKVELELPYGQVRTAVTQPVGAAGSVRLRSTAATMGVRGTEFVVQSELGDPADVNAMRTGAPSSSSGSSEGDSSKSVVTVLQGRVEVAPQTTAPSSAGETGSRAPASAPPVMLTAGTQFMASTTPMSGGASTPTTLNTEQLQNLTASARMADNTFENSVVLDLTGERSAEQNRIEQNTSGGSGESRGDTKEGSKDEVSPEKADAASGGGSASSGSDQDEGREPASSSEGTATADASSGGDSGGGSGATGSSGSAPSAPASDGGGVANFTASLITSTVEAPPPTVAAIVMPSAVISQVTSGGSGGGGFAGAIGSTSGITAAPVAVQEVGGGSKRITVIIRR